MRNFISLAFSSLLLVLLFTENSHGQELPITEQDAFQSHVEIFGHAGFLMRVNKNQKFNVSVHTHNNCNADLPSLSKVAEDEISSNGYQLASTEDETPFSIHIELIGGLDRHNHCLLSYDVSVLRNYSGTTANTYKIENAYDYMNSVHILKLSGVLHHDQDKTDNLLQSEIKKATKRLMHNLLEVQKNYPMSGFKRN